MKEIKTSYYSDDPNEEWDLKRIITMQPSRHNKMKNRLNNLLDTLKKWTKIFKKKEIIKPSFTMSSFKYFDKKGMKTATITRTEFPEGMQRPTVSAEAHLNIKNESF